MKPSLRKVLADSHIAAVAILVLLAWSLEWILSALWSPFVRVADFVFNAIAILDIPSGLGHFSIIDRVALIVSASYCIYAAISIAGAWLLSRWVYGVTPISTLREYHSRFARRSDA